MGRLADKWERKMEAVFRTAIERADAVTADEYAEAVAAALSEETGRNITGNQIENETPIQNYVSEVEAFDVDAFLRAVDWGDLADKWSDNWVAAYGL